MRIDYSIIQGVIQRMVKLRKERGMSALDLEKAMGKLGVTFTRATIANLETYRRNDIGVLELIGLSKLFAVQLEWLLLGEGPRCSFCMDSAPKGFMCTVCLIDGK